MKAASDIRDQRVGVVLQLGVQHGALLDVEGLLRLLMPLAIGTVNGTAEDGAGEVVRPAGIQLFIDALCGA